MSIDRIFYCDHEDCEVHVRTAARKPSEGAGFLTVTGEGRALHFCGWDCLMKHAAKVPPPEIIPFHESKADDE
jgi:hypothetical protein